MMLRLLLATVGLTAVYTMTLASADPWDIGVGAVLSLAVLLTFRGFLFGSREREPGLTLGGALRFPILALATAGEIVRGSIAVTRAVFSRSGPTSAGFVTIPDGDRTPTGLAINGLLVAVSPGSIPVASDAEAGTWTVHVLDAADPDAVRIEVDRFYDRYQRPIWP
jgi:multisubunit Na+/H+ antiporter MnhE subunit